MSNTALEPSLTELAAASQVDARTIRSWVAQGLLPGPTSRGPLARYPSGTLERLLAILGLREEQGMSLAAIRQELLVATPEDLRTHAAKGAAHAARRTGTAPLQSPPRSSALAYLRAMRADPGNAGSEPALGAPLMARIEETPNGFEALEQRLAAGARRPQNKARAEEWLRIPITPDVELAVRGRLDGESRARLERCADLVRDILLGKDR